MSRRLLSAFFIAAGLNHFRQPRFYEVIVPPAMQPRRRELVVLSGIAEIVGGALVLTRPTRRLGGVWLVGVLAAVFPANLYMAREPEQFDKYPRWALYARLPFQPLMMIWAWRATR
jgi:uncharacterized membrane protein